MPCRSKMHMFFSKTRMAWSHLELNLRVLRMISKVRIVGISSHQNFRQNRLLSAMCGRLRVVKGLIDITLLVGAAMCSAC